MVDKDLLLEKITNEDIVQIVEALGGDYHEEVFEGGDVTTIKFPTVCHHGDSKKLYYYTDSKLFHCYTGCQESFNIFGLVMKSLNEGFYESLMWVSNLLGYSTHSKKIGFFDVKKINDWDILDKYFKLTEEKEVVSLKKFNKEILGVFASGYYKGWLEEHIEAPTMEKYDISVDITRSRIVIPHFNEFGDLIGIRGRALIKEDAESGAKYLPLKIEKIDYRHQTKHNLFGLNHNKDAIKRIKKVMIVEAEKSTMQCDSYYGENSFTLGVSGSSVSNYQRDKIVELGVNEVIIALDKPEQTDSKIDAFNKNVLRIADKFINYCTVYVIVDDKNLTLEKDSPTDKGKEILEELMKNKVEIKGDIDYEI